MLQIRELEKAVAGEVWSGPRVYRDLIELCDRFGPRFAGTPGYDQAADWVQARLEAYGLRRVHQEGFEHVGWERGQASLEVLEPYHAVFPALALPYSPRGTVEAEIADLWSAPPEDYEAERIGGQLVLTSGATAPGVRSMHRTERYARTVAAGGAGFCFGSGTEGQLPPTGSLAHGRAGEIPGIGISAETAQALQRWLVQGPVRARLTVRGGGPRPARSHNVIGEWPGADPAGPEVVLCAHLDSHDIAPGSEDNGSGTVVVMEAARALATVGATLPGTVRFILFGAEEIGLLGSGEYVKAHQEELEHVRMVLNVDCTSMPGTLVLGLNGWPELVSTFESHMQSIDREARVVNRLVPYSDHFPFALVGVPATMVSSAAHAGVRGYAHTSADTVDKASARQLQGAAVSMARLAMRILSEDRWPAHRTLEEMRDMLIEQGIDEPLRLDGRWPY